jgi:hypothetical protein
MTTTNDIDYSHLCARDYTHPPFERYMPLSVVRQLTEKQKDVLADYDYAIHNIKYWQKELAKEYDYLMKCLADEVFMATATPYRPHNPTWTWEGYQRGRVTCAYDYLMENVVLRDRAVNDFSP